MFYVRTAYHYTVVAMDTKQERQSVRDNLGRAQMGVLRGSTQVPIVQDGSAASSDSLKTEANRRVDRRWVSRNGHHLDGIGMFGDLGLTVKSVASHRRAVVHSQDNS